MKTLHFFMLSILMITLISACAKTAELPAKTGSPQAWIDAPLDGARLPLAPYEIVFHITDDSLVTNGELSINGSIISVMPNPAGETNLATLRYLWSPSEPGVYTLQVRAQGNNGIWGDYTRVVVEIGEPTPTLTFTPVFTETPTATFTPTATATLTPTNTPTATATRRPGPDAITFVNVHPNTSQIYWRANTCGRKEVDYYVTIPSSSKASQVTLYYRLVDRENKSNVTPWYSKLMYLATGAGEEWLATVAPEAQIPGFTAFEHATIEVYFTAVNALSPNPVKSDINRSVKLDVCH